MPQIHFGAFLPIIAIIQYSSGIPLSSTASPKLANKHLNAELDNLAKHIEQINSTIFEFLAQKRLGGGGGQLEKRETELDKAEVKKLGQEKEELVKKMEMLKGRRGGVVEYEDMEEAGNWTSGKQAEGKKENPSLVTDASRLLCQFFVFGILFGVVCSISACSCIFRSRRNHTINGDHTTAHCSATGNADEANLNRLSQIREPFAPDKPYCLRFDERGLCYASPLTREVPPLPNYEQACKMPTPAEIGHKLALQRDAKPTMPPITIAPEHAISI